MIFHDIPLNIHKQYIYIYNAIVNWSHRCTQHIHSKSKYYIYILYCIKYHDILWLLMVIIPFLHHQFPPCFHDFATHVTTRFWPARRWVSSLPSWVLTSSRRWNAGFHQTFDAGCWVNCRETLGKICWEMLSLAFILPILSLAVQIELN